MERKDEFADITEAAVRLVADADAAGIMLRLTGGVAFALRTRDHIRLPRTPPLDIDLVAPGRSERRIVRFLKATGSTPDSAFNARHGDSRLLFHDRAGRKIEVFVGHFEMCHTLPLHDRLEVDSPTLPLAELLLTKLQIVELNEKDLTDMHSLLLVYQIGSDDNEAINVGRISELCAMDWGLYHTVTLNLDRIRETPASYNLDADARSTIDTRITTLSQALEDAPKSLLWRARARIGERIRWYEEPEEI